MRCSFGWLLMLRGLVAVYAAQELPSAGDSRTAADSSRRLLAIDPSSIEYTSPNTEITLGPVTKDPHNPFFGESQPWDIAWWNTYPTVAYDAKDAKFKMWYNGVGNCSCAKGHRACTVANRSTMSPGDGMCPHLGYNYTTTTFGGSSLGKTYYAESGDGIHWERPALGVVDFLGSKSNNIVLETNTDPNRGVFLDEHESNASRRFKMFGDIGTAGTHTQKHAGVATLVSADGIHWNGIQSAVSMRVAADTANNAVFDKDLKKYIAFSRNHCTHSSCNVSGWGVRRETQSTSSTWGGGWSVATEALHGEHGYEMYSLVPFRAANWTAGLYLGIGSFYETTNPEGYVRCELCRSTDFGKTWQRLAPHRNFIPPGPQNSFDSHTCYAAPAISDPTDPHTMLIYYAGGDGPHSGGGKEHGRANFMARATAATEGMAGITSTPGTGSGIIRSRPLQISGEERNLRIRTMSGSSIGVSMIDAESNVQILAGIADAPHTNDMSTATTQEVSVVWKLADAESMRSALPKQGTVILRFLLHSKSTLFSFGFD